jgi:hypothetical protein
MKNKLLHFISITLIAGLFLFIATYKIGDKFPPGLNHDAAWNGLYAIRILNGEPFTVYTSEAWGRETQSYLIKNRNEIKALPKPKFETN